MRPFLFFVFLALVIASPVPLIIDTDMGGGGCQDVDDVGTLCMANALEDNGEVKLVAVVVNTSPEYGVGVVSVLNHYYGRDHILIGAYKGTDLNPNASYLSFVSNLVEKWDSPIKRSSEVPSAVDIYRRALADQTDHSVVVSSVGLLTNFASLLQSGPDRYSSLSGYELVARKVRLLAIMAGVYGNISAPPRSACNNFCGCYDYADPVSAPVAEAASAYVISHLPPEVKILYSGMEVGREVQSGAVLETCAPASSPCRQAYLDYRDQLPGGWTDHGRASWDPLTTLAAVRGAAAVGLSECADCDGWNTINPADGQNTWRPGMATNQTYLVLNNATQAAVTLDRLYCKPPSFGLLWT